MNAVDVDQLLTGEQVADRLGISRQRVQQLAGRPDFPPSVGRVGKATVWRAGDVDDYASGIRRFITVNGFVLPLERARELAARLDRQAHGDTAAPAAAAAAAIDGLLDTGGVVWLEGARALAAFSVLQHWLEDVGLDVFGPTLMNLRYRLFADLQDAGLIPRA